MNRAGDKNNMTTIYYYKCKWYLDRHWGTPPYCAANFLFRIWKCVTSVVPLVARTRRARPFVLCFCVCIRKNNWVNWLHHVVSNLYYGQHVSTWTRAVSFMCHNKSCALCALRFFRRHFHGESHNVAAVNTRNIVVDIFDFALFDSKRTKMEYSASSGVGKKPLNESWCERTERFIINTRITTSSSQHLPDECHLPTPRCICWLVRANAYCVIMFWASSNRQDLFLLPQVDAVYFYFHFFFILSHPILKFIHTLRLVERNTMKTQPSCSWCVATV